MAIDPNFSIRVRTRVHGISVAPRPGPYLDPVDAKFVEEKRRQGVPDAHIALMLGCSLQRVQSKVVAPQLTPEAIDRQQEEAAREIATEAFLDRLVQRRIKAESDRQRRAKLRGEPTGGGE